MASTWTSVAHIPSALTPDTMMLLTDGSVFVHDAYGKAFYRLAPDDTGKYESGTWTGPFTMANTRQFFASGVLKDGRVFVVGAEYSDAAGGGSTPLGEIFDPTTNTWSPMNKPTPSFDFIYSDAVSCVLPDGRVIFGSKGGPRTAIWDPVLDLWTESGLAFGTSATNTKLGSTNEESWCLLAEGTVLTVETFNTPNTMKYVPDIDQWVGCGSTPGTLPLASLVDPVTGSTVTIREIGPGITLPDGRAFFVGGTGRTALYTQGATPSQAGTWAAGPNLPADTSANTYNQVNGNLQTAIDTPGTLLPNGQVLFVAGNTVRETGPVSFWSNPCVLYLFDPATNAITQLSPQPSSANVDTWKSRLLTLPTGQVAFTAQQGNVMEILTVDADAAAPQASWKPVITDHPATVQPGHTYTITGTQLTGLSQTSSYGDDAGVATNYPIARLKRRGSNKVAYARTSAFSSLGIATGSTPQTASMQVPASLAPGQYDLTVVANGIPSDSVPVKVAAQDCYLIVARSTFSEGEVASLINLYGSPARFDPALYVVVEGFTAADLGLTPGNLANPPHKPTIPSVNGITFRFSGPVIPQDPSLPASPQRFTFPFSAELADTSMFGFAASTLDVGITASLTAAGSTVSNAAVLQLVRTPNPYILHGDTAHGGDWYLSVDLRVFQAKAGDTRFGAHVATSGGARTAATGFIQQVMTNFNASVATANSIFDGLPSAEDQSTLALAPTDSGGTAVYNFALARVRYRDTIPADKVRVFFRMWPAQQTNAVFDPNTLYRTSPPTATGDRIALLGRQDDEIMTIPFFATPRVDTATTKMVNQTDAPNVRSIQPDPLGGGEVTAFFGAWLDINQPDDLVLPARLVGPVAANLPDGPFTGMGTLLPIQRLVRSAHQCLIAEIAFDPVPVRPGTDPSTSDKLAQRNLTFVNVPNPGLMESRWAPQTFEVRPTPPAFPPDFPPDELMLEWGSIPDGTTASICLPSASADEILALADDLYDSHRLTRVDDHTVGCPSGGVTYLPVPRGADPNFAGLLTVELPAGIHKGDVHDVTVRQLTLALSRVGGREVRDLDHGVVFAGDGRPGLEDDEGEEVDAPVVLVAAEGFHEGKGALVRWRRVLGMFKVTIPVSTKEELLAPELRLLSVLRWILDATPLLSRWHPVMVRYVDQVAARVRDLGGDPDEVPADPNGDWDGSIRGCRERPKGWEHVRDCEHAREWQHEPWCEHPREHAHAHHVHEHPTNAHDRKAEPERRCACRCECCGAGPGGHGAHPDRRSW
ncbi:MAG: hypothetical protein FWF90_01680 [Promicromonosporaceae bacterium]|nr:hypothetical protein [Promicromonosporaceae bacterium]